MSRKFLTHFILTIITSLLIGCSNEESMIEMNDNPSFSPYIPNGIITQNQAKEDLISIISDLYGGNSRGNVSSKIIESSFSVFINKDQTRSENDSTCLIHIFNFLDDQGFAIMSGNTSLPSLLALSESGHLSEDLTTDNPGLNCVLVNLMGIENGHPVDPDLPLPITPEPEETYIEEGPTQNIVYKVGGFCKVKWSQRDPYNALCPEISGEKSLTGCVPTAVAQLMSVYNYPLEYNGYNFPWNRMTEYISGGWCSSEGQNGIARIHEQLGLPENLSVSYGTEGSGAKFENVPRTFINFGYSQGGVINDYSTNTVVSELKNNFPVLICAYAKKVKKKFIGITYQTVYEDGHAWLLHGLLERKTEYRTYTGGKLVQTRYVSQWYPLCNFGWGGNSDGYYYTGVFNTIKGASYDNYYEGSRAEESTDGYNFQYQVRMLTGIRK